MRTSPWGYGRAIYLRGESGRTYVYAHLQRFGDGIRPLVRAEQLRRGRYAVNMYLSPETVRVRRGEVIALSGESGTTGPHLHFEVRDEQQRPLDPLAFFVVPDAIAPRITHLRAVPADAEARIEGGPQARIISADRGRGLQGQLPALAISGAVAFTARIVERSDIMGHRLEPHEIRVLLDGREVFGVRNDRFAFEQQGQIRLEWLEGDQARDHWLHRRPGNDLPGRSGDAWHLGPEGKGLAPGDHDLQLVVRDRAGNTARISWPLHVLGEDAAAASDAPTEEAAAVVATAGATTSSKRTGAWRTAEVGMSFVGWPRAESRLLVTPLAGARVIGDDVPSDALVPVPVVLDPAAGAPVLAETTLYVLQAGSAVVADSLLTADRGLVGCGEATWYGTGDWTIKKAPRVALAPWALPAEAGRWSTRPGGGRRKATEEVEFGVFRRDKHDAWVFAEFAAPPDSTTPYWSFALLDPGLYAVFRDVAAPRICGWDAPLRVRATSERDQHGVTLPYWDLVPVEIEDKGTGIDGDTILVWLDGVPLIAEPDPLRQRVLIELPDELPPGEHVIGIEVADRAGHFTARTLPIFCE